MEEGLKNVKQNLPFLIFPLVFSSIKLEEKNSSIILKYFSFSVLIAAFFALSKALFFKINNIGNYFFFDQLAIILDKHTTYFALFVIVTIIYFLYEATKLSWKKKMLILLLLAFSLLVLYMLSTRISVLGLIAVLLIYSFQFQTNKKSPIRSIILMLTCLSLLFVYLTPNFQKRFNSKSPDGIDISDMGSRVTHWKGVVNRIGNENVVFGSGTGDGHDGLYEEYLKLDFKTGYSYKYNAHNQYLEVILFFGFIGLLLFLFILYVILRKCIKKRDYVSFSVICVFMIFMITESILERHSGIVLFSFLISMIAVKNNKIIKRVFK
ncbi:O-antigen ligase family protein [Flavivirga eckloniae]|nr:O-antigen ligase family protein [Flavivirga eckloniae]